jgi:hypothetical protein
MSNEFDFPANRALPLHVVLRQRTTQMTESGPLSSEPTKHVYVRVSVLPEELKRRVVEAIKILGQQRL